MTAPSSLRSGSAPPHRPRPARVRRPRVAAAAIALWAIALCRVAVPAAAQPAAATPRDLRLATVAPGSAVTAPAHGELPRLFYEPRERRAIDAQERALHLGLDRTAAAPSGPRFDGWLSGPAGTHAWVNGARYRADRAGALHAVDPAATDAGGETLDAGKARFDTARGVLVVPRETEGTLRLHVGESEIPGAAVAPAGADASPGAAGAPR